jgi:MFS family permease
MAAIAFVTVLLLPKKQEEGVKVDRATSGRLRLFSISALLPGLVGVSLGFAGGAFTVFAPMHVQDIHTTSIGVYFSVYALGMLLARLFSGRFSDRRGRSWVILPGLLCSMLGMLTIAWSQGLILHLLGPFLFGFGLGAAVPGLVAWAVDRGKPSERSLSGNTYYLLYEIGLFVGPICVGKAITERGFSAMSVALGVVCIGLTIYLAWWVTHFVRTRRDQEQLGI